MRSIFELQMAVSANLSSHKGTFREDKRTLKGGYLKLCVNTCVSWTSVEIHFGGHLLELGCCSVSRF